MKIRVQSTRLSIAVYTLLLLAVLSCVKDNEREKEISKIPIKVEIERFDRILDDAQPSEFENLKKNYAFWFPRENADSLILNLKADTIQQELFDEVKKEFLDTNDLQEGIESLFQHIKYFDPQFKEPRVITVTSRVDFRNKVIVTDSIVLIALDTYLGSDHFFYEGISRYLVQNLKRDQILPDLASAYAKKYIMPKNRKKLLDEMIYYGKQLYFEDEVLPNVSDAAKIGYTEDQYLWAKANEFQIWTYFIEKELLYNTDTSLPNRFINPAPFSKFYLQLDNESPGMLGRYIGWQIVNAYMENNDVKLMDMLIADPETIFKQSNFKPEK
ncbi:gliding motility lipoprotein GldB [Aegicerativicinus sediminis]|uniref:gliding motility lipoprotein GldB n=1 Tax=Aegicerativicinus sediminis TaxID=2893202 RepID=UPI001E389140|nr:gliding motility lipoprotein GldB [Aegicerativicinus sediminis]